MDFRIIVQCPISRETAKILIQRVPDVSWAKAVALKVIEECQGKPVSIINVSEECNL